MPPETAGSSSSPAPGKYDLAVCWRIYPRVSGQPIFGFKEKFELVQLNAESFREAFGGLKVKLWVLLDNCPAEYKKLLESIFTGIDMEIISLPGEGNGATFDRQINILTTQTDADLVYFAEDDYLYLPDGLEIAAGFMRLHPEVDFVTLFDHKDHYTKYVHQAAKTHVADGGRDWRSIASTCLTFMSRRQSLIETADVFHTFGRKNSDLGLWLALTKKRIFNPWSYFRGLGDGAFIPASQCFSWWFATRQVLFGKRRTLVVPVPGLATHMEVSGLAPNVDWEKVFSPKLAALREAASGVQRSIRSST